LELHLLNRLGDATYFAGNVPGSLPIYYEADRVTDRLIARDGAIPIWLMMKGENAFNISGTLQEMKGRVAESLRVADTGLASIRALERFGLDSGTEKRMVMLLGQKAVVLGEMGRYIDAVTPSSESMAIRRRRMEAAPGNPQRVRDFAIAIPNHSEILNAAGQRKEACAIITEGVQTWKAVKARGELSAKDARQELPHSETLRKKFCNN
jgi:eukaryotic-like serine/threonine-protein kinase